jgi:hypothetical protein
MATVACLIRSDAPAARGGGTSTATTSPLLVTYTVSPACTSRSTALLLLRSSRCAIVLGIV